MALMIIMTIIFAILSAILYRAGGQSKDPTSNPKWMPMWLRESWVRDVFCTLLTIGWCLWFRPMVDWWWYVLAAGAQYGATTTYWDDSVINWMKPEDNFYLHGAFIALANLFISIPSGDWIGGVIRIFVLGLFMGLWCKYNTNDVKEEFGRGASIQATLPLLLI